MIGRLGEGMIEKLIRFTIISGDICWLSSCVYIEIFDFYRVLGAELEPMDSSCKEGRFHFNKNNF